MIADLKPYTEYKESGLPWLGQVPGHWNVVPSKALFRHRKEKARTDDKLLTASQAHGIIDRDEFMVTEGRRVMHVVTGYDILKHVEPRGSTWPTADGESLLFSGKVPQETVRDEVLRREFLGARTEAFEIAVVHRVATRWEASRGSHERTGRGEGGSLRGAPVA